MHIQHFYTLG